MQLLLTVCASCARALPSLQPAQCRDVNHNLLRAVGHGEHYVSCAPFLKCTLAAQDVSFSTWVLQRGLRERVCLLAGN